MTVDIMEELATTHAKEEPAHSLKAREIGALSNLGPFVCSPRKRRMMVAHLDQLASYQVTTWNGWP
jgi:hypothetical protein